MSNPERVITAEDRLNRGFLGFIGGVTIAGATTSLGASEILATGLGIGGAVVLYNGLRSAMNQRQLSS